MTTCARHTNIYKIDPLLAKIDKVRWCRKERNLYSNDAKKKNTVKQILWYAARTFLISENL